MAEHPAVNAGRTLALLPIACTSLCLQCVSIVLGDGAASSVSVLREWPPEGPPFLWSTDVLEGGAATPSVVDGVVYVAGGAGRCSLFAFGMDGRLLWRRQYGQEMRDGMERGRATGPAAGRDAVVVTSPAGDVAAVRPDGQAVMWEFNIFKRYGGVCPSGGYGAAPLWSGDKVLLVCSGTDGLAPALVAVNSLTGETVWSAPSLVGGHGACGGGVALLRHSKGDIAIAPFPRGIIAVEASTGGKVWGWHTVGGGVTAVPLCSDGHAYVPALGGRVAAKPAATAWPGGVMLRITEDRGYLELWKGPPVRAGEGVILDGRLFAGDSCFDVTTGRRMGRLDGLGGKVACADGLLYYVQDGSLVSLVDTAMGDMRLAGRFTAEGLGTNCAVAAPCIADGRLFLRNGERMVVHDLMAEPECSGSGGPNGGRYGGAAPPVRWSRRANVLWQRRLPHAALSAPVAHAGKILMAGDPGTVVCCDAGTGATEWVYDRDPRADRKRRGSNVAAEPLVSGDKVWARFADGTVVCLGLDGSPRWTVSLPRATNRTSVCAVSDGTLVLGGGELVGLDAASGAERWRLRTQEGQCDVVARAWLRERGVVVTSGGYIVRSRDGTVIARDVPSGMDGCVAAVGGTVYAAAACAEGYVLDAWRLPGTAERGIPVRRIWQVRGRGSPVRIVICEGRIAVLAGDGAVHLHDAGSGAETARIECGPAVRAALPDSSLWSVADRLYVGARGGRGGVGVVSGLTGDQVWSFATQEPLAGMSFRGGRQFIRAGSVLHCIGGRTPSRDGVAAVVETEPDSWFSLRGRRPIARVVPGEMPRLWLCAGPLPWRRDADPLQSLGGCAAARPVPGEPVAADNAGVRFRAVTDKSQRVTVADRDGGPALRFAGQEDRTALPCAYYLFTTLERFSTGWFRLLTSGPGMVPDEGNVPRVRTWVGGREAKMGDIVRLGSGRTALMVEVVFESQAADGCLLSPRFSDVEQSEVESARTADAAWREYERESAGTFMLR
jgi:outer membrane protein assembly factor BamB